MRIAPLVLAIVAPAMASCGTAHFPYEPGDGGPGRDAHEGGRDSGPEADAEPEAGRDAPLECGDERAPVRTEPQAIVNGSETWDPLVVALTEGQAMAVGAVMARVEGSFQNICTGTLVAPNAVATAAHCVLDWMSWPPEVTSPEDMRFAVGDDVATPAATFEVASVTRNPGYETGWESSAESDVAVLVLAEDATAALPGIEPIPLNCTPLDDLGVVGQSVQNVGYGVTEAGWMPPPNTRKWWTVEELVTLGEFEYVVDGHGVSGVCNGDSGGPTLWTMPDGVIRVIGTLSWGAPSCVDQDHFARADWNCGFFDEQIGGCGAVTAEGSCAGETAVYCEGDSVVTRDCAALGMTCADDGTGRMRCVEVDPCGGLTYLGRCETDLRALYCEDGVPREDVCRGGERCGQDAAGRSRCLEPEDPCGGLGWQGRCEGDDAVWCDGGEVRRRRCGDCLQRCGWSATHNGFYCL